MKKKEMKSKEKGGAKIKMLLKEDAKQDKKMVAKMKHSCGRGK